MLLQLLMSLSWQSVLVLHQQELDVHFGRPLEASGISIVDYNIKSFTEENLRTIVRDIETMLKPRLNVLLFCDVTSAVSVFHQMSQFCDTKSNFSVDLCHVSRVLVVGTSDDLPVLLDSNIQVENVAVLELPSRQGNSTNSRMWTLMFHPNGRAFTNVALFKGAVRNPTDVFPNVKFGYNGRQLSAVMKDNSFGYGDVEVNKRKLFGFPYKVLQLLADAMNVRVILPREDEWGKNINGSWSGLIGMLQRREADLASDILTIHSVRTSVTDYILPPICETRQVIMYKQEEEDDQDIILLRPFSLYVYIVLGASLVACIIFVSSCMIVQNNEFESGKYPTGASKVQTITQTTFEILGATLKQASRVKSSYTSTSDRILVAGWWLLTIVVSAVYCGSIMTAFAIKLETPPFANVAELAAKEDYKIGYDSSSITENILQNSRNPDVKIIKQRVQELSTSDPDVHSTNGTKHLQRVWQGKYAYMTDFLLTGLNNASCKLKFINTGSGRAFLAFHVPRWSPFRQDFQNSMSYLSDSGLLHRAFIEWFPPTSDGCSKDDFPEPVSLAKIQSIFMALGGGVVCGFVILAAEFVWFKMKPEHR